MAELQDVLTPYNQRGSRMMNSSYIAGYDTRYRKSQEQKEVQDNSWFTHVELLIFVIAKQAQGHETSPYMSKEEVNVIWDDMDNYRYGYVSASQIQRWLQEVADFNLPFDDLHWIYNCFQVKELDGRIIAAQFYKILCGQSPYEDEPDQEEEQHEEGDNEDDQN